MASAHQAKVRLSNHYLLPLQVQGRTQLHQTKGLSESDHQVVLESSCQSHEMAEARPTPRVDSQPARLLHLLLVLLHRKPPTPAVKRRMANWRKTSQSNRSPGRTSSSASPTTRT